MILSIIKGVEFALKKLLITLSSGIYGIVNIVYRIFLVLAHLNFFSDSDYNHFVSKIYMILGVIMLFIMAYNILTYIVDPDKNKNGQSTEKTFKKIIVSVALIALCPYIFNLATRIQTVILDGGVIDNIFLGVEEDIDTGSDSDSEDSTSLDPGDHPVDNGALLMEYNTFQAFFYANSNVNGNIWLKHEEGIKLEKDGSILTGSKDIKDFDEDSDWKISCEGVELNCQDEFCSLNEAKKAAYKCDTYEPYKWFAAAEVYDKIDYHFLISLAAGIYLVYVMISFCFDVTSRVFKLFLYEILAPLCIAFNVVPGKDSVFKTWKKLVFNTYLSVFIRVFVMRLSVWIMVAYCSTDPFGKMNVTHTGGVVKAFASAFIVMGLVTFIKEVPNLITQLFGLEDIKAGNIVDKIKAGGGFAMAGLALGTTKSALQSGGSTIKKNWKKGAGLGNLKAIGKGLGSAVIGGGMGAFIGASSATNSFGMGALKEQMGKINKDINSNTLKATTKKDKIGRGISDFGTRIKDYFGAKNRDYSADEALIASKKSQLADYEKRVAYDNNHDEQLKTQLDNKITNLKNNLKYDGVLYDKIDDDVNKKQQVLDTMENRKVQFEQLDSDIMNLQASITADTPDYLKYDIEKQIDAKRGEQAALGFNIADYDAAKNDLDAAKLKRDNILSNPVYASNIKDIQDMEAEKISLQSNIDSRNSSLESKVLEINTLESNLTSEKSHNNELMTSWDSFMNDIKSSISQKGLTFFTGEDLEASRRVADTSIKAMNDAANAAIAKDRSKLYVDDSILLDAFKKDGMLEATLGITKDPNGKLKASNEEAYNILKQELIGNDSDEILQTVSARLAKLNSPYNADAFNNLVSNLSSKGININPDALSGSLSAVASVTLDKAMSTAYQNSMTGNTDQNVYKTDADREKARKSDEGDAFMQAHEDFTTVAKQLSSISDLLRNPLDDNGKIDKSKTKIGSVNEVVDSATAEEIKKLRDDIKKADERNEKIRRNKNLQQQITDAKLGGGNKDSK